MANDLLNPQMLGFSTIMLITLSHLTYMYNSSLNKDKYMTILFSLFLVNLAYYLIQWIYFSFSSSEPLYLLQKTGFTIVYNTIVSSIVIFIIFLIDKLKIVIYD